MSEAGSAPTAVKEVFQEIEREEPGIGQEPFSIEEEPSWFWPEASVEQRKRLKPGGEAPTRVVKVTYLDEDTRFDEGRTLRIHQFRVPMASMKTFDIFRLHAELQSLGIGILEVVVPFKPDGKKTPHYCELNECWKPAKEIEREDGVKVWDAFCTASHKTLAMGAADRFWVLEG